MRRLERARRRVIARLGSVALVAGLGLAAFGGAAFGGAAFGGAAFGGAAFGAVPPAKYVGIVISGHGSYCVRWTKGITGDTVLNDVAAVVYRNDGLIVQIDRSPASPTADDTHYWSYWHDPSGAWQYSDFGPSGFQPIAGSVEGWSYDDGHANPPAPTADPAGLYASLCGAKDANVSPRPTRTATQTSAVPSRGDTRASRSRTSVATPTSPTSRGSRSAASSSIPASSAPASSSAAAATTPVSSASAAAMTAHTSTGSPTGLFVGLGLAVLVAGGGAGLAVRRRNAGG